MTERTGTVLPFVDGRQECGRPGVDPDLFFAPDGEGKAARRAREVEARAVCARCPLLAGCRGHAEGSAEWGVWGGTTDDDRYETQRSRGRWLGGNPDAARRGMARRGYRPKTKTKTTTTTETTQEAAMTEQQQRTTRSAS